MCAASVHVDVDGSGEVSPGDIRSTQYVGVGPEDDGRVVEVPLQQLG